MAPLDFTTVEQKRMPLRSPVSASIRNSTPAKTTSTTTAASIFKLSPELLLEIYKTLDHAPSQVSLALSCKTFASLADLTNRSANFGLAQAYLDNWRLQPPATDPGDLSSMHPQERSMRGLGRDTQLDRMKKSAREGLVMAKLKNYLELLVGWMPQTHWQCTQCLVYKFAEPGEWWWQWRKKRINKRSWQQSWARAPATWTTGAMTQQRCFCTACHVQFHLEKKHVRW